MQRYWSIGVAVFSCVFLSPVAAKADWVYDSLVFTYNFEQSGCSGTYTGMYCRDGGAASSETPFEKRLREKSERERLSLQSTAKDAATAIDDLIRRSPEILEPFSPLPRYSEILSAPYEDVVCLRGSLTALLLLQENPSMFAELASVKYKLGSHDPQKIGTYHALQHARGMYYAASRIMGGSINLNDTRFADEMQRLFLSQLGPSLMQSAYFIDNYDLLTGGSTILNADVSQTALSVGFRIGFFSEAIAGSDYPFTTKYCGADIANFQGGKELEDLVRALAYDGFSLDKILPSKVRAAINSGFSLAETSGAINSGSGVAETSAEVNSGSVVVETSACSWGGVWNTKWQMPSGGVDAAPVTLTVNGTGSVEGFWGTGALAGGIQGIVQGDLFSGTWTERGQVGGSFKLQMLPDSSNGGCEFTGEWDTGGSQGWWWRGER